MKVFPDYTYALSYLIIINLKKIESQKVHELWPCTTSFPVYTACLAFIGLLSPMLRGPAVLHFLGAYFLPLHNPIFLQSFQPTNYKAGNQMSKLLKTVSKINITIL